MEKTLVSGQQRRREERPDAEWVRGQCPLCGEDLVANCYYVGGKGYLIAHECWSSLGDAPTCHYRRIL